MDNRLKTYKDYIYMLFGKDPETDILPIEPEQMFNPKWILENSIYESPHKCAETAMSFISNEFYEGRTSFYRNIYNLMKECIKVLNKYIKSAIPEDKETDEYKKIKSHLSKFKKMMKDVTVSKSTYCIYRIIDEDDDGNETVIYESPEMIDRFGPLKYNPDADPIFNYNNHSYNLLLDYSQKYDYCDYDYAPNHYEYVYSTDNGKCISRSSMIENYYNT